MARVENVGQIWSKRKATAAFFPYAVRQERDGKSGMIDVFLGVAKASKSGEFMWRKVQPFVATLFDEASPDSLDRVIALISPYVHWGAGSANKNMVIRWAAAVSAVSYTEVIGESVVNALLQIAYIHSLRPHIPVDTWSWLNKRPSLPPVCRGRSRGTTVDVVRRVRALQDVETLRSYLLLVWSEYGYIDPKGLIEMATLIKEDFSEIGMWRHRKDLIKHLDHLLTDRRPGHVVGQHTPPLWHPRVQRAKVQYLRLKEMLLEVDRKSADQAKAILTSTPSRSINLVTFTHPKGYGQNPTLLCSVVRSLSRARSRSYATLAACLLNSIIYSHGTDSSPQHPSSFTITPFRITHASLATSRVAV